MADEAATDVPQIQDAPPAPMMGVQPPLIMRGDPNQPRAPMGVPSDPTFAERQLQYRVANLPLAQAQQAVSAAMKFQGQRGYQQDLAAGKPANEALAKWAPMMFYEHPSTFSGAVTAAMKPRPAPPTWVPPDPATGAPGHFVTPSGSMHVPAAAKVDKPVYRESFGEIVRIDPDGTISKVYPPEKGQAPPPPNLIERFKAMLGGSRAPASSPAAAGEAGVSVRPPTGQPTSKVERAKQLRQQHPDWTKQQIIDAVNKG